MTTSKIPDFVSEGLRADTLRDGIITRNHLSRRLRLMSDIDRVVLWITATLVALMAAGVLPD